MSRTCERRADCVRKLGHDGECIPAFPVLENNKLIQLRREVAAVEERAATLQREAHELERRQRAAAEWTGR